MSLGMTFALEVELLCVSDQCKELKQKLLFPNIPMCLSCTFVPTSNYIFNYSKNGIFQIQIQEDPGREDVVDRDRTEFCSQLVLSHTELCTVIMIHQP